ncbi:MAG TPA: bifunctional diguanylate cyclase/phosphodiesterase, partial [Thermosulfurimonas dismutans]|nr:bifunctional diguanylate cyclase/phosphodiesterase [Thermosulfurimonas dismutans]
EFQMKFLENFIITSEAVIDWEYIVINALDGISDKICFTFFFVVFREEGEDFYAYIFWNTRVHGDCQRKVEELIEKHLRQSGAWEEEAGITYIHREVETKRSPEKRPVEDLEAYTRVLVLEKPLIGGALGLGMNLLDVQSEVKGLAVQSVLPTLLNIVGSAKAIHKYTKELEYYATRDPLTELYNQRVLWELLDYEVERARRHNYKFAFLIVDIDNFKLINDAYGHEFGDQMLKGIAGILRDMFRKEDLVARYGGDEFAMVLPYAGEEQAYSVALRLLKNIEEFSLISPEGQKVKATASIGIAVFPDHARDAKQLFLIADNMLYKAKREGKNKVALPSPEDLSLIAEEVLKKSSILSTAVEEKRVLPYFQPIVDVHTLEARAYEVLMRIEQPDGRILPAREFIHIAETSGLLQRMDLTLLENAARRISAEATEAEFFFNLSPKSLVLPSFIEEVRYILRKYNVPPHRIVFELTERETVKNLKILKDFVRNLKKDGFKFAVDDFGSGFSSFTYIKHFPIDYLKIEGDFIRSMARNKVDLALVQSAVTLARTLNIKTIAEFVEDEEIFRKVREVGIDLAQGYYLGKPRREIGGP